MWRKIYPTIKMWPHKILRCKHPKVSIRSNRTNLSKELGVFQLIAIGVGTTIGPGIFVVAGTVAREKTGPALPISFVIAGSAAALSGLCYAELASRFPCAGSAYHYAHMCIGEGLAWLVGWALLLEYTVTGATAARGISPNLALLVGGAEKLPQWLVRRHILGTGMIIDPCAGILVILVAGLLCLGIKESAGAQSFATSGLVAILLLVIILGGWVGAKNGWIGYKLHTGYFPYGFQGVFQGSAMLFFSYIGFDAIASTAEEVKKPQRDLPLGIAASLLVCIILYTLVSVMLVGIVPFDHLNVDTPLSSAFSAYGMKWAMYLEAVGALAAMLTTVLGSFIPQPRILMSMSQDGLLPSLFGSVNKRTTVPIYSTLIPGFIGAILALVLDIEDLSELVSVGSLSAFTSVAVCVLLIRYIPPNGDYSNEGQDLPPIQHTDTETSFVSSDFANLKPSSAARLGIIAILLGAIISSLAASIKLVPRALRVIPGIVGTASILLGLGTLIRSKKAEPVGFSGFMCPMVPLLPALTVLVNTYLLVNIRGLTWIRVSVWLLLGVLVYVFYGMHHRVEGEDSQSST